MESLADEATLLIGSWPAAAQLPGFFRSGITPQGKRHHIPAFHGIPKIHKTPTGMRPIIPCHSAVQNPAAKFVSKVLKPLIDRSPVILQSSRQFCSDLEKIHISDPTKLWLVTGDVVAFYPNVPLMSALENAYEMARVYYCDLYPLMIADDHPFWRVLGTCLAVGNKNLVSQFNGRYYEQKRGLAMGVADSPDLANLYAVQFEVNQGQIINKPWLKYYKRYIDDIFAVVEAPSEQEALRLVEASVSFVGCEITWSASLTVCPFLDVHVFKDPRDPERLHYKPYRKARNHLERISWISHHPFDVKRGTFLGEMSRMASLCSTRKLYNEAIHELQGLYIARGYPVRIIQTWTRGKVLDIWKKRCNPPTVIVDGGEKATFVVLKSEFNPILNYFNAKELSDTIVSTWRQSMESWADDKIPQPYLNEDAALFKTSLLEDTNFSSSFPDDVVTRKGFNRGAAGGKVLLDVTKLNSLMRACWLISRKRTRNLFDLANVWKRMVLTNMDHNVFDDLTSYRPDLGRVGSPEPSDDLYWSEALSGHKVPTPEEIPSRGVKRRALDTAEESRMRARPRLSGATVSTGVARTSASGETPSARVLSAWGRRNISDVPLGTAALPGLITRYAHIVDRKGKKRDT